MGAEALAVAGLASGLAGAYGTYQSGKQERTAYDANANLIGAQADEIRAAGALHLQKDEVKLRTDLSSMDAQAAASGVVIDTGSPLIAEIQSESNARFDMAIDQYNTEMQAKAVTDQSNMLRWEGKMAEKSAKMKAITSAAGSLASFGYSQFGGATKIGDTSGGKGTRIATTGNTRSGTVYGVRHG